jgi:hypothetical protein
MKGNQVLQALFGIAIIAFIASLFWPQQWLAFAQDCMKLLFGALLMAFQREEGITPPTVNMPTNPIITT